MSSAPRSAVTVAGPPRATSEGGDGKTIRSRRAKRRSGERDTTLITIEVRDAEEAQEVRALVDAMLPQIRDHNERVRDVLDAILPPETLLGPGAAAQSRRNAVLRDAIARQFGLLSAADVAELAGSRATNAAATANRWRTAGRIFHVPVGSMSLYPGFQFDADGAPLPQVARVLELLGAELHGWELAAWLTQPLDELEGQMPVEVWERDETAVYQAADAYLAALDA